MSLYVSIQVCFCGETFVATIAKVFEESFVRKHHVIVKVLLVGEVYLANEADFRARIWQVELFVEQKTVT